MAPSSPVGFCTISMQDGAGRGESCFPRCGPRCTAIHQEAEQLQLVWLHSSENIFLKDKYVTLEDLCYVNMSSSLS